MDLVVGEGMVTRVDMQLTERERETDREKRERERLNSKKERLRKNQKIKREIVRGRERERDI